MTTEQYKKRMAELGIDRENLEERIKPFYQSHPAHWKESVYVPGGEKRSTVPVIPPGEDLSHLNAKAWRTSQAAGRKNGGRKKR